MIMETVKQKVLIKIQDTTLSFLQLETKPDTSKQYIILALENRPFLVKLREILKEKKNILKN